MLIFLKKKNLWPKLHIRDRSLKEARKCSLGGNSFQSATVLIAIYFVRRTFLSGGSSRTPSVLVRNVLCSMSHGQVHEKAATVRLILTVVIDIADMYLSRCSLPVKGFFFFFFFFGRNSNCTNVPSFGEHPRARGLTLQTSACNCRNSQPLKLWKFSVLSLPNSPRGAT